MQRKVFDKLVSGSGAVLVVVLLVAGGLLTWGASFAHGNVHDQLAQQKIFFPTKAEVTAVQHDYATTGKTSDGEFPNRAMVAQIAPYAGKQVLTGKEAQVYANWFIGQHLAAMPYKGVYSLISTASRAAKPGSAQAKSLSALEQTSFQGTTLRGILLEAYAFGTIGDVMMWGAVASFVLAVILAILVGAGVWHASRTRDEDPLFTAHGAQTVPTA